MFYSNYRHNVDTKGRVFIPARWRSDLSDTVIITIDESGRDQGGFLQCMALEEWERYVKTFSMIQRTNDEAMGILRVMMANTFDCEMDKQGRILIPQYLRDYAGITGEVLMNGIFDRVEIWDPEAWEAYRGDVSKNRRERLDALNKAMKPQTEAVK